MPNSKESKGSRITPRNLTKISNEELVSSPKTAEVFKEVKRRIDSGDLKLPEGFDTSKSKVSVLMDVLSKKK
jgi:hypothetical protein